MRWPSARPILVVLCAVVLAPPAVRAGDFRIETEIYVGDAKEPAIENLTLFSGDVVFDFLLTEPKEITVFDVKRGRFILLDPTRRVQTTLKTDDLAKFAEALKSHESEGPLAFFLNPRFDEQFDSEKGQLTLSSKPLTYHVKGEPPKLPEAVSRYRQFADWYARLNATEPGNLPPFARLELNRALAEKGWIPSEVERTIRLTRGLTGGKQLARSEHSAVWRLSNRDRQRISEAARYQARFDTVSLGQYRQRAASAQRPDHPRN